MLLTIDIGNSSTKFGIFEEGQLVEKFAIKTVREDSAESIYSQISDNISDNISAIVVSTVVGELIESYNSFGEIYFNLEPFFADHKFDYGFSINYFPPETCGSDRLVAAFAAVEKYGKPVIVCDFGTATNIEVVNAKNEYIGGIITPGINTLANSLFSKTSKLPLVEIAKPKKVIGNSTVNSIQSGIYNGYISMVDGLIRKIMDELNDRPRVISTGGFAGLIAEESDIIELVENNLTLEGLRLVYERLNGN